MQKTFRLALALTAVAATPAMAAPLPGGATTLQETYDDWTVSCQTADKNAVCAMRQIQSNSKTGQRVLLAELKNSAKGGSEGILLLPFGLDLAKGVTDKIDEKDGSQRQFSTCLPQGCLVPVTFTDKQIATLSTGKSLHIQATSLEPSQPVDFTVSLKGFGAAYNRMTTLIK